VEQQVKFVLLLGYLAVQQSAAIAVGVGANFKSSMGTVQVQVQVSPIKLNRAI
jgi:hypothetical protein